MHLEELALKGADHAWLELVLLGSHLGDVLEVIGTNGGLLSGVVFGSIDEELILVELWWLSCVGSDLEFNVELPILVSLGLLSLDPLDVGSAWLLLWSTTSLLRGWGLTNGSKGISGNSRWVLKTDIVAVNVNTSTASWVFGADGLVSVHSGGDIIVSVVVNVTASTDEVLWNWSAEVTSSLLVGLLVGRSDEGMVVHDVVPECKFHIADKFHDSVKFGFSDPLSNVSKIRSITHAGTNGVTMEHTSWELITWRPGVTESVWSALMGLPKVTILGSDVTLHGFTNNDIAEILEFSIIVATLSTEFSCNKSWSSLLNKLEKRHILDTSHLNDFGDTV